LGLTRAVLRLGRNGAAGPGVTVNVARLSLSIIQSQPQVVVHLTKEENPQITQISQI